MVNGSAMKSPCSCSPLATGIAVYILYHLNPQRQNRLWGQHSLLSNGYLGKATKSVKLITHLHPIVRSRLVGL
jgi:hypothetical protein